MSKAADLLRWRREALLRRTDVQRQDLRGHMELISGTLDRVDRGLEMVRRVATPPVLVVSGVALALLLGRGGGRRVLAAGLTLLGVFLRARSAAQVLAGHAADQAVRRSR